jgi:hypothetical protein
MRIGVIGPADGVEEEFREAVSFLLGDADVEQVVYLGTGEFVERAIKAWALELGGEHAEDSFLERAALLARQGRPEDIEHLLEVDASRSRLEFVRKLPPSPARAIEMMDDRVVLFVHDKAILNEEDIANAQLIVYGRANESDLRRFGRRTFFTPGPLHGGRVGVLEASEDRVTVSLYDLAGIPVWRESVAPKATKVMVAK